MPKYMIVYKGDATDPADMPEEQRNEIMAAWGAWMERVGSGLTDVGTPLMALASVVDDGSAGTPVSLSGYSVVEAADLDELKSHVKDHPFLSEGKGNFAIDVYEMLPVPM